MPNSAGYKSLLSKPLVCEYAKRSNAFRIRLSELQKIKQIEKDFLMDNNGSNAAIRGKVHFIGIGGCSMNGLAQILRGRGFEVQGSDSQIS